MRVRGRVAADVDVAWLETGATSECSGDPTFELVQDDGSRVRVVSDPASDWRWLSRSYAGPFGELAEYDPDHPFRDREHDDEGIRYARVVLARGVKLDVWGSPDYAAAQGGYRETKPGPVEAVRAARVRRDSGDAPEPLSRSMIAGAAAAVVLAGVALSTRAPLLGLRCALMLGLASVRTLHRQASPLAPPEPPPVRPLLRALLHTWFWAYLAVAFLIPVAEAWLRVSAGAVVALVLSRWAWVTRRDRHFEIVAALLSPESVDGVVVDACVRTPTVTLAPDDVAVTWTDRLAGWQTIAAASVEGHGFERGGGECALAALIDGKWALVRSYVPSIRATVRRAQRWDRSMPWIYLVMSAVAIASVWSRV